MYENTSRIPKVQIYQLSQHFYDPKNLCYVGGMKGVTAKLVVSQGMSDFPILLAMLML
jgi:hypothetical protein